MFPDPVDVNPLADHRPPSLLPTPAPQAVPRFCRACGAAWDATWAECAACAVPRPVMPAVVENDRSVVYALSLYFAWLAVSLTVLIWTVAKGDPVTIDFAYCVVASAMVLAWCVPAAARRAVAEGLRRVRPLWCVVGAASGVVTFSVAGALVYGFNHLFELAEYSYTDHLFDAGWGWGMSILVVAVQPAIFEELAFRGVVFSALRRVLESREAVLVTALMFMILHLSVLSFPHLLLIGLVLGWLRVRTGSLVPGMFLHFTHNLLCVAWERYWAA